MTPPPAVSVVIPTYQRRQYVCLMRARAIGLALRLGRVGLAARLAAG